MRRFYLYRSEDKTGTSGTGIVAEGCVFSDKSVAMRWLSATPSWVMYSSIEDVESVHGHNGRTAVVWEDE